MPEVSKVDAPPEGAALIAEYERAVHDLGQQRQGALTMLAKVMHLEGSWAWKDGAFVRPDGVE